MATVKPSLCKQVRQLAVLLIPYLICEILRWQARMTPLQQARFLAQLDMDGSDLAHEIVAMRPRFLAT
jgi:uncharacterized membrane protein YjgN (DUF898 family)